MVSMNDTAIDFSKWSEYDLKILYHKLKQFDTYKASNMLDFMTYYPKQEDFRSKVLNRLKKENLDFKVACIMGANRSGKTLTTMSIVSEAFETIPNVQIVCATVDYKMSVSVQQKKLHELLRKSNIKYGHYNPIRGYTKEVITGKNGAKILFRTYQGGRESIQGLDVDLFVFDEEPDMSYYLEGLTRTTDRSGIALFSFTALKGYTQIVNEVFESNNPLIYTTVLTLKDNTFIPEDSKQQFMSMIDSDEADARVWGKVCLKQGLIYKEFKGIHIIPRFDYKALVKGLPRRYELHEGIDPHSRTEHHWARFLFDREENKLTLVEELKAPYEAMLVKDFARLIKSKRDGMLPLFCQIDTSSMTPNVIYKHPDEEQSDFHTIRSEFNNCGIETLLCTKDNAMGISAVKERLKVVKTISGEVKRAPLFYVFKDCNDTIWEFKRYSWDSYSSSMSIEKKELINKPLKKNDHFMDVIKYECIKLKMDMGEDVERYEPVIYSEMGY